MKRLTLLVALLALSLPALARGPAKPPHPEHRPAALVWACKIIRKAPVVIRVCKPTWE